MSRRWRRNRRRPKSHQRAQKQHSQTTGHNTPDGEGIGDNEQPCLPLAQENGGGSSPSVAARGPSESEMGAGEVDRSHSEADHYLTPYQARQLESLALKYGWIHGRRWPTEASVADLKMAELNRPLTIKEKAIISTHRCLTMTEDPRVMCSATRNVVAMEGQNQKDDLIEFEAGKSEQHLHLHQDTVQIVLPHNNRNELSNGNGRKRGNGKPA